MSSVLFSILGRPRVDPAATAPQTGRYKPATYGFDGVPYASSLFALALLRHLRASDSFPGRIIFLGTTGSAWGALAEQIPDPPTALWERLLGWESEEPESVTEPAFARGLRELATALSQALGVEVVCQGIETLTTADDQGKLLATVRDLLRPSGAGEGRAFQRIVADVTHGLGHQRILLAQTLLALESLIDVRVEALYSGAFELSDGAGVAPAVRLDGMLRAARVDRAIAVARRTGDPGDIAQLIDAGPLRAPLRAVADAWRLHQPTLLRQHVSVSLGALRALPPPQRAELRGVDEFLGALLDELNGSVAAQQFKGARAAVARGDLLRASLSLREACITVACAAVGHDLNDVGFREGFRVPGAPAWLEDPHKAVVVTIDGERFDAWRTVQRVRNAIAHGTPSDIPQVQALLAKGPEKVAEVLELLATKLESELKLIAPAAFR